MKKKYTKIGILGGTYDPPHIGHLHISKVGKKKLKLNKMLWIVTKRNPLKQKPFLKIGDRIKLSKQITKKEVKIFIKYLDNKINSTNTFDLIKYLKKRNKKNKLYFFIGADNLVNLHKWKKWKRIPELATIIVFARTNYSTKALKSIAAKKLEKNDWIYINDKKMNISSSLIRKFSVT